MASIYKRSRLAPIPDGATCVEQSAEVPGRPPHRSARWVDARGRTQEAPLNTRGDRIVLPPAKDAVWHIAYQDPATGQRVTVKAFRDMDATRERARTLERDAERRAAGLVDPFEQFLRQPIDDALADFMAGQTATRAPQIRMQVGRIIDGTGARRLCELDAPKIEAWLRSQQQPQRGQTDALGRPRKPMSDTTYNEYIASVRAFTRWAVTNRRLPHDPLVGLKRIPAKRVTRKHPRRALTLEQLGALLAAAERRAERELLTIRRGERRGREAAKVRPRALERARALGRERRLCYLLAFWLRLRRSEIAALEWRDVRLDTVPASVTLRAETTKAKRADSLPLHPQLREELSKVWRPDLQPTQRVVRTVPDMKAFRADLAAAGIAERDERGLVDLHALGKSLITAMHANGVSQRSAQALARHSDPRLTAVTYTDASLLPLAEELAKVPPIPVPPAAAPGATESGAAATKTTPASTTYKPELAAPLQRRGCVGVQNGSIPCSEPKGELGESTGGAGGGEPAEQSAQVLGVAQETKNPAPSGAGFSNERVIGVEPTTFTLAT